MQGGQPTDHHKGITERGRAMVREMNRLGMLIDITHGTEAVQLQPIEASTGSREPRRDPGGGGRGASRLSS